MAVVTSVSGFIECLKRSRLLDAAALEQVLELARADGLTHADLADTLARSGILTRFQAKQLLEGRSRGFLVADKYKLLDLLGSGGMGSVYLCEHTRLETLVAVKVLPKKDPVALQRFRREARAAAALHHPNVVRAFDIDEHGGVDFLVMEYVDGVNLQNLVAERGPLPPELAAHYAVQVAQGLQAIADQGWVHRDIKPSNLMLSRSGVVKILDFGLARVFDDRGEGVTKEFGQQGALGTADYLSPEGTVNSSMVDIRADIYSLGGTLYYFLSGRAPFQGATLAQKLVAASMYDPETLDGTGHNVPPELSLVVKRMMAKEPAHRFQRPDEVAAALAPFAARPGPPPAEWFAPVEPALSRFNSGERSRLAAAAGATPPAFEATLTMAPPDRAAGRVPAPPAPVTPPPPPARFDYPTPRGGVPVFPASGSAFPVLGPPTPQPQPPQGAPPSYPLGLARFVVGGLAAVLLLVVGVVYFALRPGPPPPKHDDWTPEQLEEIYKKKLPNGRRQTIVASTVPGMFDSLNSALPTTRPGDHVMVLDRRTPAAVVIDGGQFGNHVTIQGAYQQNRANRAVWEPLPGVPGGQPLLRVVNVERLVVRGFVFDGKGRVDDLVHVVGRCPGVVFEDVEFRGFRNRGVVFAGCAGEPDAPVRLENAGFVVTSGTPESAAAFTPAAGEPVAPAHFDVVNCRFEGPLPAALRVETPLQYCKVERGRFNRCRWVIDAAKADLPKLRVSVEQSTFADADAVVRLAGLPPKDPTNQVRLQRNLLWRTRALVRADGGADADRLRALFPVPEGNSADPDSNTQGEFAAVRMNRVPFDLPTDYADERTFLRYRKDSPLASAYLGSMPVGAPPE